MRKTERPRRRMMPTCVVSPTLRRARSAIQTLSQRLDGPLEPATLAKVLDRVRAVSVILCPEGKDLAQDLAFLRQARDQLLWGAPDEDLHAAITGLRGEHDDPVPPRGRKSKAGNRRLALLLEGPVRANRARGALASDARVWIVETPFAVRLSARERRRLAQAGVVWHALAPIEVRALVASRKLARARSRWRDLLPSRTKVILIGR